MPFPKKISEDAIVEKAVEMIRSGGREALSMRPLAAALEVQASSLYRHFPNREALDVALSEHAAGRLEERMRSACRKKPEPRDALRAVSREYLRFARDEQALFELLVAGGEGARPAGKSLWNFLLQIVHGVTGKADDTASTVALWSFLHGFAVLEASGAFGSSGPKHGFEVGLEALIRGLPAG
jgi:AcrR family transcriptional regulator